MNEVLALVAIGGTAASGLLGAIAGWRTRLGDRIFAATMMLGSSCGLAAGLRAIAGAETGTWSRPWRVPGGVLEVRVDALSGMFLAQIFLIAALGTIYGLGYWSAQDHPQTAGKLRVFYGLMVAGMALLVVSRNSILFLMGWEIMALSAFFTITTEDHDRVVREVGFVYLVATRVGTLFVFATFAILRWQTGSFSLSTAGLAGSSPAATAVFLLGIVGFGLKAGLMPLHIWLPGAHANAPSHVSAVMSGVLIKMGIYGLVRTCSLFDGIPVWWGVVLLALGMASAVFGVAFAIGQHDLKRLLAYHSVENIGIIVMGLGLALIGRSTGHTALMALGLAGSLLHVWNHGLFKALLFLSAGSVIHATHTRQIDALGGLGKQLPRTALAFLVGAVAICGLPPLNGFVSELFIYLGMLRAGALDLGTIGIAAVLGVPVLALVGALAALCFSKVFGIVFLGAPRSDHVKKVRESPASMLAPMAVLGALCIFIGALPPLVAPVLERATSAWLGAEMRLDLHAFAPLRSIAWVNALLTICVLVVSAIVIKLSARALRTPTWDCGYAAPTPRMQYTASSFGGWVVGMFAVVLRPRVHAPELSGPFPAPTRFASHVPEVVLELGILPLARALSRVAAWFRWIQHGDVHLYVLYVFGALVLMLFVWR
ncbi:MAG TPA: proton-conducting transporter membrane subunit [Polyangiaceae bacterium]